MAMSLSSIARLAKPSPAFSNHVSTIIKVCAKEQMFGIHTAWIITMMADQHSFWNRAIKHHPSPPMGHYQFLPVVARETAIPFECASTDPIPTAVLCA